LPENKKTSTKKAKVPKSSKSHKRKAVVEDSLPKSAQKNLQKKTQKNVQKNSQRNTQKSLKKIEPLSSSTNEIVSSSASLKKRNSSGTNKKVTAEVVTTTDTKTKKSSVSPGKLPALGDGLSQYLEAISRYPLLTREQEAEIAKRYRENGTPEDAEILVTANLRFVVKVAAEYSKFGNKLIDLIQEGNVGLMHAVREFNPYKGVRLITYAVWWIKGYIQDYLMRQHSMVRIGTTQNQRKLFYNLEKEKKRLDMLGLEPTVKLLSDNLGVTEKDVKIMESRMFQKDFSLDAPLGDGNSSFIDLESSSDASAEDLFMAKEQLNQLANSLDALRAKLNKKELLILEQRILGDPPRTLKDIGDEWKVTREAVRQMESRVLKKIKNSFLDQGQSDPNN